MVFNQQIKDKRINTLKSFIFSTDNDRGGVMLCDIETLEDAVVYLNKRFPGIVKIEMGNNFWTLEKGFDVPTKKMADTLTQCL